MPFFPNEMEFCVLSVNGVPVEPAKAGRIRIVDDGKDLAHMQIRRCDEEAWITPSAKDVDWLIKVMQQYSK
jgi:hypothetical protein